MQETQCSSCRYFVEGKESYPAEQERLGEGESLGTCHRNCPVAREHGGGDAKKNPGYWPIVRSSGWCGEYKEKPSDGDGCNVGVLECSSSACSCNGKANMAECNRASRLSG